MSKSWDSPPRSRGAILDWLVRVNAQVSQWAASMSWWRLILLVFVILIASSIIGLGRSLDLTVVAEGIETADQLAQLLALGCEVGQGFHLARPATPEQIEPLLTAAPPEPQAIAPAGRPAA